MRREGLIICKSKGGACGLFSGACAENGREWVAGRRLIGREQREGEIFGGSGAAVRGFF
jgi:hypothetical protein